MISVIVPIYKVEQYIERCAIALFEQTLEDIEYIFVNDCTPDNSMEILTSVISRYPDRKNRVKIINLPKNGGLPSARKEGIQVAQGDYICHCDSDDWPEPDMYKTLYEEAVHGDFDIVYCDYYKNDGVSPIRVSQYTPNRLLTGPIWNRLIRREICQNNPILYPTYGKAEDGVFMMQYSYYSKRISYVAKPLYNYYINPTSICNTNTLDACIQKCRQQSENAKLISDFFSDKKISKSEEAIIARVKYGARRNLLPYIDDPNVYKMWRECFPELDKRFYMVRCLAWRSSISYLLVRFNMSALFKTFVQKY